MSLSYRVIYPRGNRKLLDVAQVWDYESDEWALASRRQFDNQAEAVEHAKDLAERHRLRYCGLGAEPDYLD